MPNANLLSDDTMMPIPGYFKAYGRGILCIWKKLNDSLERVTAGMQKKHEGTELKSLELESV